MVAFSMALSRLLLLLVLCSVAFCARLEKPQLGDKKKLGFFPPSCNRIECPTYEVVAQGNGYEIRRYESTAWTSTQPMEDISLVNATRTAFFLLFDYIQGKNGYGQKIEMTAPVIAEVLPSDGPFCASSFVVSFYLPKINQADPPPADNLRTRRWAPAMSLSGSFLALSLTMPLVSRRRHSTTASPEPSGLPLLTAPAPLTLLQPPTRLPSIIPPLNSQAGSMRYGFS